MTTVRSRARRPAAPRQSFLFSEAMPDVGGSAPLVLDYFAGGGGASEGIRRALGRGPDVAINHCEAAIAMHAVNHPETEHFCESVWKVRSRQHLPAGRVRLIWFSPDCKHHSRAKGGKPVDKKIRALPWVVPLVARERTPDVMVVENVPEFRDWGPLDANNQPIKERRGETFAKWAKKIRSLGYQLEAQVLCAADYGAPTSRRRLFVIMRRDGQPIVWPEPTHGPGRPLPHRTAAECIDWSLPMESIFDRKKPLVEATCRRIAEGIRRFVLNHPAPFLLGVGADGGLLSPSLIQTSYGERQGQAPRVLDLHKPMGTVVAGGCKQGLVAAFLQKHNGKTIGQPLDAPLATLVSTNNKSLVGVHVTKFYGTSTGAAADGPLPTITATGQHLGLVAAFLSKYYSADSNGQPLGVPIGTIVTKDRFALVAVVINGETYVLTDILFRMLKPRELARGQGFGDGYKLTGTETQQVERIGNSVCPPLAEAIVRANVTLDDERTRRPEAAE